MTEENKKISFGFAKSIKKPVLKNVKPHEVKKVDYIQSVGESGIKIIGEEEKKEAEPLVIPLRGSKTWHDRIINKVNADIYKPNTTSDKDESVPEIKQEASDVPNGRISHSNANASATEIKTELSNNTGELPITLEEQAAKELIEELKSGENKTENANVLTVPVTHEESIEGAEEPTLEEYEQIPVDGFGIAMLRGMDWQPGKGIGKNPKVVTLTDPESRSRWMGLGTNKTTSQKQSTNRQEEELKLQKGAYVKITAGKHNNSYAQVENIDDNPGWLTVKLALGGDIISVNELMVQVVTKSEYSKNSKVLNASKYEEYKKQEGKNTKSNISSESSDVEDRNEKKRDSNKKKNSSDSKSTKVTSDRKKSKEYKKYSSDSDTDVERRNRKRRSSSNNDNYNTSTSKKSKKQKKRYGSPEYSNRKHKKKDKEREKTRDRKSRDSRSPDRRKHRRR